MRYEFKPEIISNASWNWIIHSHTHTHTRILSLSFKPLWPINSLIIGQLWINQKYDRFASICDWWCAIHCYWCWNYRPCEVRKAHIWTVRQWVCSRITTTVTTFMTHFWLVKWFVHPSSRVNLSTRPSFICVVLWVFFLLFLWWLLFVKALDLNAEAVNTISGH